MSDSGRPAARRRDVLAAGAERAGGERARRRRRTTPLLEDAEGSGATASAEGGGGAAGADGGRVDSDAGAQVTADAGAQAGADGGRQADGRQRGGRQRSGRRTTRAPAAAEKAGAARPERPERPARPRRRPAPRPDAPVDVPETRPEPRRRSSGPPRRLHAVPAVGQAPGDGRSADLAAHAGELGESIVEGLGDDAPHSEVAAKVAEALALLRRRLTGEYEVDEFGFDPELTDTLVLPLLRPLYRRWFRVEVRGVENVPAQGGALVVANHSGTIALDALMTQVAVHDEHPEHRHLRMLGADLVFGLPVVGDLARKTGSTLAANPDAERLLAAGEVVGVWPEGFKGIGKPFSERYKLQRFGRGGFVSAALRTRTPIVPCSIVGAEEIYPILGNVATLARLLGTPYAPITPTWPWLGPLGLIPLPSKWLIEFGAPIETADLGDPQLGDPAEDPMLVFDLTDRVRETIQHTLYSLLVQRRSVFF